MKEVMLKPETFEVLGKIYSDPKQINAFFFDLYHDSVATNSMVNRCNGSSTYYYPSKFEIFQEAMDEMYELQYSFAINKGSRKLYEEVERYWNSELNGADIIELWMTFRQNDLESLKKEMYTPLYVPAKKGSFEWAYAKDIIKGLDTLQFSYYDDNFDVRKPQVLEHYSLKGIKNSPYREVW